MNERNSQLFHQCWIAIQIYFSSGSGSRDASGRLQKSAILAPLPLTELPLSVWGKNKPELVQHLEYLWESFKPTFVCLGSSATAHEVEVHKSAISERFGQGQCFTPEQRCASS